MQKTAEKTLSEVFFGGLEEVNTGRKNVSYHFVEGVQKEMTTKRSSDNMFKRNLERWTQSLSFINAVIPRALISPRIVRPVAKLIRKILKDQVKPTEKKKKMTNNAWTLPESTSFSSRTSDKERCRKHARHRRAKKEEAPRESKEYRKDRKGNHKRSS